jgi:hypothetical protein
MLNSFNLAAGQLIEFNEPGDFFRILAAVAPVTVRYYNKGREIAEAEGVGAGYAEQFKADSFDRITIYSATTQDMQVVSRFGSVVSYDEPPVGNVSVVNTSGPFTQTRVSVGTSSATVMAFGTNRRYLLIQNKDAAATVYLTFNNTAATVANGVRLEPGESIEFQGYVPSLPVNAIASAVTNDVIILEG